MKFHSNCRIISIIALLPLLLLSAGCATSRLPPKLASSERAILLQAKQFPIVVAVQEYKYPVYSKKLIRDLRSTGLFKDVQQAEDLSGVDFLARVEDTVHGTACIPLLTGITLGIIPTSVQEEHGNDFSIEPMFPMGNKVRIPYRYSTESVLGWKALFLNFSPNWSLVAHDRTSRYRDRFALSLLKNKILMEMIKKKTEPSTESDGLKPAP
jgi:hypothetical protein